MEVSSKGLTFLLRWEGYIPFLYDDAAGHATVAIGLLVHLGNYHRQRGVCKLCDNWPRESDPKSMWITEERALELLRAAAKVYGDWVEQNSRKLNQNEFDALTSLTFNIGRGGYSGSPVRTAVNNGGDVCKAMLAHIYAGGVVLDALVRRRRDECAFFYSNAPAPPPQEDDMWYRFNEAAQNEFWKGGKHAFVAGAAVLNLTVDLPLVMAKAPDAIDIDFFAHVGSGFEVLDGNNGAFAGRLEMGEPSGTIRVKPIGEQITLKSNGNFTVGLGVVGYVK